MKILVTGGAGYIGSHAVYELIEQGYEVVIVDNLEKGFISNIHPQAKFYKVDLRNKEKLNDVFKQEKDIKSVMHFAGSIVVPESVQKPLEYFNNNVYSVQILLEIMNLYNVTNFVFSSTAAVYGEPKKVPIEEDDIKEPINPYGQSKFTAELLIQSWAKAYNGNYVIFRYFNVAGAHSSRKIGIKGKSLTHLVPLVIDTALDAENRVLNIYGNNYPTKDGTCIRDFVHVVDLVQAHILGLEWSIKNNKSNIFNIGSSSGYSVLEVYNQTIKTLNLKIKHQMCKKRDGDPAVLLASTKKIKEHLSWEPKKTLDEIIKTEYDFRQKLNELKNK